MELGHTATLASFSSTALPKTCIDANSAGTTNDGTWFSEYLLRMVPPTVAYVHQNDCPCYPNDMASHLCFDMALPTDRGHYDPGLGNRGQSYDQNITKSNEVQQVTIVPARAIQNHTDDQPTAVTASPKSRNTLAKSPINQPP